MIHQMLALVTFVAALGSAVIGGVFFAFSSFVLPALARLPGLDGMVAMQSINVVVLNRSFLGVFAGTAIACAVVVVVGRGSEISRRRVKGCRAIDDCAYPNVGHGSV